MEEHVLRWLHQQSTPALDALFRASHQLGTFAWCASLVALMVAWHAVRRQPRDVLAWLSVGVATFVVPEVLKGVMARPRPDLWPWLVSVVGYSFPSGHAAASAALYPLLTWDVLRGRQGLARVAYALGFILAVPVGLGRLYLGVHWPSDVVAGWAVGILLGALAIVVIERGLRQEGESRRAEKSRRGLSR